MRRSHSYILVVAACLLKTVVLALGLSHYSGFFKIITPQPIAIALGLLGFLTLNLSSGIIVGAIKARLLWPRLRSIKTLDSTKEIFGDKEAETNLRSPFGPLIGFIERLVVGLAGLSSFTSLFVVAGAWISIKIALDWEYIKTVKLRAVSHIYLISTSISILAAAIDVVFIRAILGLPLL